MSVERLGIPEIYLLKLPLLLVRSYLVCVRQWSYESFFPQELEVPGLWICGQEQYQFPNARTLHVCQLILVFLQCSFQGLSYYLLTLKTLFCGVASKLGPYSSLLDRRYQSSYIGFSCKEQNRMYFVFLHSPQQRRVTSCLSIFSPRRLIRIPMTASRQSDHHSFFCSPHKPVRQRQESISCRVYDWYRFVRLCPALVLEILYCDRVPFSLQFLLKTTLAPCMQLFVLFQFQLNVYSFVFSC